MNASTFKAILRWVLLSLCTLHGTFVVGQTTSSVPTDYVFPSELPIGTNIDQKLRQRANRFVVHGYLVYEVDGIRQYKALDTKYLENSVQVSNTVEDSQLAITAFPIGNELLENAVEQMNILGESIDAPEIAFASVTMSLMEGYETSLYGSTKTFYVIRNQEQRYETGKFLMEDELVLRPSYWSEAGDGMFDYGIPDNAKFTFVGAMLDAVDENGNPVTSSSQTGTLFAQESNRVVLPQKVVDGSMSGTLYLEVNAWPERSVRPPNQIFGVDLKTGRISRPELKFKGLRVRGPLYINGPKGERFMEMRPKYLMPRGTTYASYVSTNLVGGKWNLAVQSHAGSGGSEPWVEFEQGILTVNAENAFCKSVVDDAAYPLAILKALPPPEK